MKKLIALLVIVCASVATAQTNTATPDYGNTSTLPTPTTLTSKFNSDYPNNDPTWTTDGPNYRAQFNDATTTSDRYVTYDKDGNVVMRGDQLPADQYPNALTEFYSKTYPNDKNYDVWSSQDTTGNKAYYVNRDNETVWFDNNGKYKSTTKTKSKKTPTTNKNKK